MTIGRNSGASFLSASEYILDNFEPSDRIAMLVLNRDLGEVLQRVTTAKKASSPEFQAWLRHKNATGSDIYIGMNPLRKRAATRTKQDIKSIVSALGYPGFAYLKARVKERNPAETLVEALSQTRLESRVVEALPWLLLTYWDMSLGWLVKEAKLNNLQNRLGFVESLAEEVSKRSGSWDEERNRALSELRTMLEKSRLAREDTFLKPVNTEVEREWLRENRSDEARHWNLLTNWRPEHLQYDS